MELLKKGSKGAQVSELQTNLCHVGHLTAIDGDFGPQTTRNLKAFQKANSLKPDGVYGPITKNVLKQKVMGLPVAMPAPVSNTDTPWMDWMERNKGQKEISGAKANPFIVDLFLYTSLAGHPLTTTDETAWCAALACAALEKNGYESPNSASAASFDKYGTTCDLKYGAILTFKRTGGSGRHVTFYAGRDAKGNIRCLGGNQGNALKISSYSQDGLVSVKWPVKKT